MGRASDLNERILISMVRDGYWRVDVEGRVWIVRVKSGPTKGLPRRAEHCTPQGYLQVRALIDGKRLHCGAHRLVWQHAHGDIPAGREINHANGIKDDNRPGNLLCCTAGENVSHAHRGGLQAARGLALLSADAEPYAYQPRALANLVYGGRNGNTDSDDGWNYRGRGPIQTTGKRNYARQGAALGLPLLANPSLLAQPEVGSRGSAWQWNADGCHELADQADLQGVRRRINGGLTGFDEFVAAYHRFLEA